MIEPEPALTLTDRPAELSSGFCRLPWALLREATPPGSKLLPSRPKSSFLRQSLRPKAKTPEIHLENQGFRCFELVEPGGFESQTSISRPNQGFSALCKKF